MDYMQNAIKHNAHWVEKAYLAVPQADPATARYYLSSADKMFKRIETYLDTPTVRHLHLLQESAKRSLQDKTAAA